MRKFLSRKGGGFSASSLVLNSTTSTCALAGLQMSPVLRRRSSVKF